MSNILAALGRELSGSVLKITFIINDIKKKFIENKKIKVLIKKFPAINDIGNTDSKKIPN